MALDSRIVIQPNCNLVKVRDAALTDDGKIVGTFGSESWQFPDPVRLCEFFANCRTNQEILDFTKRYGPVYMKSDPDKPKWVEMADGSIEKRGYPFGRKFELSLSRWHLHQQSFRDQWKMLSIMPSRPVNDPYPVSRDDMFSLSKRGNEFIFCDLYRLMFFLLLVLPRERRRLCARPECGNLFFAEHLKQIYCKLRKKPQCARWGQLKAKRDYWDRNKNKQELLDKIKT